MIRRERLDDGEIQPFLVCDWCKKNEFDGIGLETDRLVRACARDLEGYRSRKFLVPNEGDSVKCIKLDLCAPCQEPMNISVIHWCIAISPAASFSKSKTKARKP